MATYKAVMRQALEYASSVWSPIASSTSINKLQVMQNAALMIPVNRDKLIREKIEATQTIYGTLRTIKRKQINEIYAGMSQSRSKQLEDPRHDHTINDTDFTNIIVLNQTTTFYIPMVHVTGLGGGGNRHKCCILRIKLFTLKHRKYNWFGS